MDDSTPRGCSRKRRLDQIVDDKKSETPTNRTTTVDTLSSTVEDTYIVDSSPTTMNDESTKQPSSASLLPPTITQLKLEAIFHPKFENENRSNMEIRTQMKQRIALGKGHLEVSLKHSGSLLLWSGGQRYYSKNSTDNVFTHVGEVLLRQHFYRAYHQRKNDDKTEPERAYQECSHYITKHRLTLAFELVTGMLGHHGAIPHYDFLILTAVADRKAARFYSTAELLQFAQAFHLPHNDIWVFSTDNSVNALFELYDSTRETGLASTTIPKLTKEAQVHVCSMYPHEVFQGNILEGIVIRYVPYHHDKNWKQLEQPPQQESNDNTTRNLTMQQLAVASEEILRNIRPETPPCHVLASESRDKQQLSPPVLTTNLRDIFQQAIAAAATPPNASKSGTDDNSRGEDTTSSSRDRFASQVQRILIQSDGGEDKRRAVERLSKPSAVRGSVRNKEEADVGIPIMMQQLLESDKSNNSLDDETKQIANMILKLDHVKGRTDYNVLHEMDPMTGQSRWLCIIHVMLDSTFLKFEKQRKKGDMALFRGFCIEFVPDGGDNENNDETTSTDEPTIVGIRTSDVVSEADSDEDEPLMLKMKFLPYMVRTFGCRNGLRTLSQGGTDAYDRYTMNLMTNWQISQKAKEKWQPFFHAWGVYAYPRLNERKLDSSQTSEGSKEEPMPPLNSTYYLDHLETFSEQYYSGNLAPDTSNDPHSACTFRGLVVVASLEQQTSELVADYIAKELGGARRCHKLHNIRENDLIMSRRSQGGGLVCSATVHDRVTHLRKQCKAFGESISIVLFGCDEESIAASLPIDQNKNKVKGMVKAWQKTRCSVVLELQASSLFGKDEQETNDTDSFERKINPDVSFKRMLEKLWKLSNTIPIHDTRPGLLIFFPGIPGCGKSALCGPKASQEIERIVQDSTDSSNRETGETMQPRNVVVRIGDEVKKKYWPLVKQERGMDPSSVYIADKNVPPSSWTGVGEVCSMSQGIGVPVLPDEKALVTTSITGIVGTDGTLNDKISHHYPFSLPFLAVCMLRVLDRPPGSHRGKLDSATKNACMIVAKFFCLYRKISADELLDTISMKVEAAGAVPLSAPIRVPFFVGHSLPDIPNDLVDGLRHALQVMYGWEREGKDASSSDSNSVDEVETRLRLLLQTHGAMLHDLTVNEEESQKSFLLQLAERIKELDSAGPSSENSMLSLPQAAQSLEKPPPFVKLASVDIGVEAVHDLVRKAAEFNTSVSEWLKMATCDSTKSTGSGRLPGNGFVNNTHVTMAHFSTTKQTTMHELYGELEGRSVLVAVTGFLWNDKVAAFSVDVASETDDNSKIAVPASRNDFSHITVWCAAESGAALSNELPEWVGAGKAERFIFEQPQMINGTFSFWGKRKKSK